TAQTDVESYILRPRSALSGLLGNASYTGLPVSCWRKRSAIGRHRSATSRQTFSKYIRLDESSSAREIRSETMDIGQTAPPSVVRDTLCPKEGSPSPPVRIVARRPPEAAARRRASSCAAATFSSLRDGTGGGADALISGVLTKHMAIIPLGERDRQRWP